MKEELEQMNAAAELVRTREEEEDAQRRKLRDRFDQLLRSDPFVWSPLVVNRLNAHEMRVAAVHDELRSRGIADPKLPEPPRPDCVTA